MPDFSRVARYMADTLVMEKGVPGCEIRVCRDHERLFEYYCGHADYEKERHASRRDIYFMYSCTKPLTCAAVMRLAERGEIGLDRPVSDYIPAYDGAFTIKDGKKVPLSRVMTIRHLFTMTAGLDYNLFAEPIRRANAEEGGHATALRLAEAFPESPLSFEPGERFQYSLCHDVLAAVTEAVTGMRFSEYLQKTVFEPLGMENASMHLTSSQEKRLAAQAQYSYDNENNKINPIPLKNNYIISDRYDSGGAGLICGADDYIKFADTLACGGMSDSGYRLLNPGSVKLLRTEQLSSVADDPSFSCAAGPGYGYGLGVRTLVSREHSRSPIGEFGWDGAAGSYVLIDDINRLSIFFAMHVVNWPSLIGFGHMPLRDLTYEALGL